MPNNVSNVFPLPWITLVLWVPPMGRSAAFLVTESQIFLLKKSILYHQPLQIKKADYICSLAFKKQDTEQFQNIYYSYMTWVHKKTNSELTFVIQQAVNHPVTVLGVPWGTLKALLLTIYWSTVFPIQSHLALKVVVSGTIFHHWSRP